MIHLFSNIESILSSFAYVVCVLTNYPLMTINCLQVMSVLKASIQCGITDVTLTWSLPIGCTVINVPENVSAIFDGEMFILYCIISGNVEEVRDNIRTFSNLHVYLSASYKNIYCVLFKEHKNSPWLNS